MNIPITKPYFGKEEELAVIDPIRSGWVVQGPKVAEFEQSFAKQTNSVHCVASTSCTTALHLAVAALNLKPGDEVVVPAFTWISTANVIEYMGAKPVFCDIDLATFNIDPVSAASVIGPRTVGIIPVHLFGLAADMTSILQLAQKHNLWIVEDAACGLGARINGKHVGTFGDCGCFSFHPRKSITTGEGGMLTTGDASLAEVCASLRDHGADRTDLERHTAKHGYLLPTYNLLGYNYRMTDLQAALGCAQLDRTQEILTLRQKLADAYTKEINNFPWLSAPITPEGFEHGYQAYVCFYKAEQLNAKNLEALHKERNQLMSKLQERGIATRQGTHAAALQNFYREKYNYKPEDFPNSWAADRLSLALPLFPQLTADEQSYVIRTLAESASV